MADDKPMDVDESLRGHLLIASPKLVDPNFHRTVVLMIQHTDDGALGLVLNRSTGKLLQNIWSEISEKPCDGELVLHLGGPVPGPLMALHTAEWLSDSEVLPGVFFHRGPRKDRGDRRPQRPHTQSLRGSFGMGWRPTGKRAQTGRLAHPAGHVRERLSRPRRTVGGDHETARQLHPPSKVQEQARSK